MVCVAVLIVQAGQLKHSYGACINEGIVWGFELQLPFGRPPSNCEMRSSATATAKARRPAKNVYASLSVLAVSQQEVQHFQGASGRDLKTVPCWNDSPVLPGLSN
jgi:hypothetical protein